jgi:putative transposase
VLPDARDAVVDFVRSFSERTELSPARVLTYLAIAPTQFYRWAERYGRVNTHNGQILRDDSVTPEQLAAILAYHDTQDGYRGLTFMMLDADIVAVTPTTVHRVLEQAGVLDR